MAQCDCTASLCSTAGHHRGASVGGSGNQITLGSGHSTVIARGGSNTFILDDSNAKLVLGPSSNMVFVNGGSDPITDAPSGTDSLILAIGASGGVVSISNFSAGHGIVDLPTSLATSLGWSMPTQVASALARDHHGGSLLSLGPHGSIDWLNIPVADLAASNFRIG